MDYASIVGLVTFLVMMVMIFAGIPVFVSMLASAFGGFIALYQGNLTMMITKFTTAPFELGANYNYAVLPMFMLVGALAGETGIAGGAFAAMKAWLAFWASSMHQPMLYRLQQVSSRRLLSNLVSEFRRELPRQQAQEAGYGLAALIDGLWLRAALSGKALDKPLAHSLTRHFITQHLPTD